MLAATKVSLPVCLATSLVPTYKNSPDECRFQIAVNKGFSSVAKLKDVLPSV
jgi:hypothetical protein